jgi:hypothetical protein
MDVHRFLGPFHRRVSAEADRVKWYLYFLIPVGVLSALAVFLTVITFLAVRTSGSHSLPSECRRVHLQDWSGPSAGITTPNQGGVNMIECKTALGNWAMWAIY